MGACGEARPDQTGMTRTLNLSNRVAIPSSCPLWVKSRHGILGLRCPLYPQKRTSIRPSPMSALCQ